MKIEKIVTKVSRVYYTDEGIYLRLIEDDWDMPYWYVQDFDGWVRMNYEDVIYEIEKAEYDYDLKIK